MFFPISPFLPQSSSSCLLPQYDLRQFLAVQTALHIWHPPPSTPRLAISPPPPFLSDRFVTAVWIFFLCISLCPSSGFFLPFQVIFLCVSAFSFLTVYFPPPSLPAPFESPVVLRRPFATTVPSTAFYLRRRTSKCFSPCLPPLSRIIKRPWLVDECRLTPTDPTLPLTSFRFERFLIHAFFGRPPPLPIFAALGLRFRPLEGLLRV